MKDRTAQEEATFGQMKEIVATLVQAVPAKLSFDDAERIIGNKNLLIGGVKKLFAERFQNDRGAMLLDWRNFYKQEFNLDVDMSKVRIPGRPREFDRLIVVAIGATLNRAYEACRKSFKCYAYAGDLDKEVLANDRDPKNGNYAIWIRGRQEADKELKNLSTNDLETMNVRGITLLERIIFELKYFKETGKHLDISSRTICSGSRGSGDIVPLAYWYDVDDEFGVHWRSTDTLGHSLRSRQITS